MTIIEHTPYTRACRIASETAESVLNDAVTFFKAHPTFDNRRIVDMALRACVEAGELRQVEVHLFMAEVEIVNRLIEAAARSLRNAKAEQQINDLVAPFGNRS